MVRRRKSVKIKSSSKQRRRNFEHDRRQALVMPMADPWSIGTLFDRAFAWRKAECVQVGGDLEGRCSHNFDMCKEWLILIVFILVPNDDVISGVVVGVWMG